MSTLRINNIEAQSIPASPTIDEKVKVTNSSGDILVNIDGKTSGITTIGINTTDGNIKFDANSNVLITGILTATTLSGNFTPTSLEVGSNIKLGNAGVITATSFVGSGANLTSLPAQATIANNADNRIITGGSGVNLNGEANLTFDTTNGLVCDSGTVRCNNGFSSDVDLILNADANNNGTGSIIFKESGSEKARITSGGLVGIGTISPKLLLHLHQENSNATFAHFTNTTTGVNGNQGVSFGLDSNEDATIYHYGSKAIRFATGGTEKVRINSSGKVIVGNNGTTFGNAAVQAFIQHGNTAGESGFSSVDTTSVAAGVGGEIAFHGKYNTGAQDYAYFGHIRGTKENATAGDTACALKFFTRPNATAPQERLRITSAGHLRPAANATYDLGMSGAAWRNLYVNDAHFSNEGGSNSVDGTWGSWTLQEGENDIFMINNRTGKKYAITMKEVN